jgi:hypothetical protein
LTSLCAGVRFLLARSEGTLLGDGLAEVLQMGAVEHVFMEVPVGSTLRLPPDDYDLRGWPPWWLAAPSTPP